MEKEKSKWTNICQQVMGYAPGVPVCAGLFQVGRSPEEGLVLGGLVVALHHQRQERRLAASFIIHPPAVWNEAVSEGAPGRVSELTGAQTAEGEVSSHTGRVGAERELDAAKTKHKLKYPGGKGEGDTDGWRCEAGETVSHRSTR